MNIVIYELSKMITTKYSHFIILWCFLNLPDIKVLQIVSRLIKVIEGKRRESKFTETHRTNICDLLHIYNIHTYTHISFSFFPSQYMNTFKQAYVMWLGLEKENKLWHLSSLWQWDLISPNYFFSSFPVGKRKPGRCPRACQSWSGTVVWVFIPFPHFGLQT